jgi:hypothetical protein
LPTGIETVFFSFVCPSLPSHPRSSAFTPRMTIIVRRRNRSLVQSRIDIQL